MYLLGNLPFFKIHVNCFVTQDDSPCASAISKCMWWVRGLVPLSVLRHFLSLVSSLLISVVLEKTLESPLDCREIQLVHPKGDQSWLFIGRTDVETETPILWPPDAMSWLIGKDPDVGKDWGQEEKGTTEDEMVGWRHQLDGHRFGWTPGAVDGQRGLECCVSWGHKESDTTERLNWTDALCTHL